MAHRVDQHILVVDRHRVDLLLWSRFLSSIAGSVTDTVGCSDLSGAGVLVVKETGDSDVDRGGGRVDGGVLVDDGSGGFEDEVSDDDGVGEEVNGGEGIKAAGLKGE